jgi:hypothetical protein
LKKIRKGVLGLLLLSFTLTTVPMVNAWFTISHGTYITIEDVEEPYFLDLLIEKPEAPLLTPSQIATLLPADYAASPFVEALNGVRDADGFVSLRLYPEYFTSINKIREHTTEFSTDHQRPLSFKIILVFEDGSTNVSPIITQRLYSADITYNMESVGMQEYPQSESFYVPHPFGDGEQPFWDFGPISIVVYGILAALVFELFVLYVFGYRKWKSYLIVGTMQLIALAGGFSIPLLAESIPIVLMITLFAIALSVWILLTSLYLPKWLTEKRMERTMIYTFLSYLITVYSVLLIHVLY